MDRIVRVTVAAGDAEVAADELWLAGASAVHEETMDDGAVRLTADVADQSGLARWGPEVVEVDGAAHLDAWRPWARPVRAGARLVLQPPWLPMPTTSADDVVVRLDPGRSFGSGSHPSTRLVLAELEATIQGGELVLDVGCGSGVLSVTAALLGARRVVAVDLDPAAVATTGRVSTDNGVADRVEPSVTEVGGLDVVADLVVANIGRSVLVALAGALAPKVGPGGTLVVSGLLPGDAGAVVDAYGRHGLIELRRPELEGWVAPVLHRPG